MIVRISIPIVCLIIGVWPLAAQDSTKYKPIWFSASADKVLKQASLVKITNAGDYKDETGIVILCGGSTPKFVDSANVSQIQFGVDDKGKPADIMVLTDMTKITGEVKSSFRIEDKLIQSPFSRANLKVILFPPKKQGKPAAQDCKVSAEGSSLIPSSTPLSEPVRCHLLYCMGGAHYAQINDFGNESPYQSSSRYAKVAPGMKLIVRSDGNWELDYNMLALSGPVQANWELKIRYQDEFGSHREIPLQTSSFRINQTKSKEQKIQDISHTGNHPAIRDYFANICATGSYCRTGHIQFVTETDVDFEDSSN